MLWKSHAALANAKQLARSFQALSQRQRERSFSWRFQPFSPLDSSQDGLRNIQQIESSIRAGYYNDSVILIIKLVLDCIL